MYIGVDATSWSSGRGYGRYTRELLGALVPLAHASGHEVSLLADALTAREIGESLAPGHIVEVPTRRSPAEAAASGGSRTPGEMLRFTRALRRLAPDVFFFPTVWSWFPVPRRQRNLVTIHDAIAERFPLLTLPTFKDRLFWRLKVRSALRRSPLVLTVSHHAARDLEQRLGIASHRLRVSGEAPAEIFAHDVCQEAVDAARKRVGLPPDLPYLTYVGGFSPHKRIDTLLEALARVRARGRHDLRLVLVGALEGDVFHGCLGSLRQQARTLKLEDALVWPGFLPDEEVRDLHAGAVACVLPSECEGFGLPAVEAAATGTAVVATLESPLPEVLEGGGWFVAPGDVEALAEALEEALENPERLSVHARTARQAARALSWRQAARATLDALMEIGP